LVSAAGISKRIEIVKAIPPGFRFEQNAIAAIKKIRWTPAKQRDRKIEAWVTFPVKFMLSN